MSEILTVAEAADRAKVHENTILRALRSGELVGSKPARHWRIFTDDLERWVRSSRPQIPHAPRRRAGTKRASERGSLRAIEGGTR